ncbi:hypothetical protein RhiXN_00952 [Rhizoctonia solani]|uniref:BTB domain-containing protein n=1 Tax=Rhizoctonia solani TaxID=456999 RepID=A0A8H8NT45_9AGAM|nr:uncharacterized protein RhiXN_00952 [Rhizoctonia solani]QRW19546.1 hypothetical protein RhiXN_00952 [Rhizoctonia solani]
MRSTDIDYDSPTTPNGDSGKFPEISSNGLGVAKSYDFVFDREDGDVELQASGQRLLIESREFEHYVLAGLVRDSTESSRRASTIGQIQLPRVTVKCDAQLVGDFNNTLKILYASVIEGPFDFDTATLISALRVSTVYEYDALRQFSISKLQQAELSAIQRIKIAQELDVVHWTEPAFEELANRVEPIEPEEARILGIDALLRVSNMREQRRTRRADDDENTLVSDTDTLMGVQPGKSRVQLPCNDDSDELDADEDTVYHFPNSDDDMLGEKAKTAWLEWQCPAYEFMFPRNRGANDSK